MTAEYSAPSFEIIDIEAELANRTLPLDKVDELKVSELRGNHFDLHIVRPEVVTLRLGEEIGRIQADGTIRLITGKRPGEALNTFKILISIAKKLEEFDENEEIFNLDIVLILYFISKQGAINVLTRFITEEKLEALSQRLGERIVAPYFGIYLREFGKTDEKERIDMDIEPAATNINKYWVKARWKLEEQKGIGRLKEYIDEIVRKTSSVVAFLEGEE